MKTTDLVISLSFFGTAALVALAPLALGVPALALPALFGSLALTTMGVVAGWSK